MAHISEISWHVTPFRTQRWLDLWGPAAAKAAEYGAESWQIYRSNEDPLLFRQVTSGRRRADFENYWYSDELCDYRERDNRSLRQAAAAGLEHPDRLRMRRRSMPPARTGRVGPASG